MKRLQIKEWLVIIAVFGSILALYQRVTRVETKCDMILRLMDSRQYSDKG